MNTAQFVHNKLYNHLKLVGLWDTYSPEKQEDSCTTCLFHKAPKTAGSQNAFNIGRNLGLMCYMI